MRTLRRNNWLRFALTASALIAALALVAAAPSGQAAFEFRVSGGNLEWRYQSSDNSNAWATALPVDELTGNGDSLTTDEFTTLLETRTGALISQAQLDDAIRRATGATSGSLSFFSEQSSAQSGRAVASVDFEDTTQSTPLVDASAAGFMSGEMVSLALADGSNLGMETANEFGGVFFADVQLPNDAPPGTDTSTSIGYVLRATGATSGTVALAIITVENKFFN